RWILGYKILELLRRVESPHHPQQLAIETVNERSVSHTQPDRAFGNGFKHRLKVKRRPANDLKYLGRGGLLLQRFSEIVRALTQFVKKPRIFYSDNGLSSEILHQRDLLVGKWAYLGPIDGHAADQFVLLEHRHDDQRSGPSRFNEGRDARVMPIVGRVGRQVGNVHDI